MTVQFDIEQEASTAANAIADAARAQPRTEGHPFTMEALVDNIRPAIERCATTYEVALGDVQADLSHASAQLDATQSQRDDLEARLSTAEEALEACETQAYLAIANGRREIAALRSQIGELEQTIEGLREQLEAAQTGGGEPSAQVVHLREELERYKAHAAFLTARLRSAMSQLGEFEDKAKEQMAEWKGRIEALPAMTLGEIEAAYEHAIRKLEAIGTTTEYFTIARMAALLLSPWEEIQDTLANDEPSAALSAGIESK